MKTETEIYIVSEFEKQRKKIYNSNAPKDDFKIIENIAKDLNVGFLEVLNILEADKNIEANAKFKNPFPNA